MNSGVLTFGAGGRIGTTNSAPTDFNGGTPTAAGLLSIVSSAPDEFVAGLGYADTGSLCVAAGGTIAGYVAGIPITADGRVCTEEANAASYGNGGFGYTASGRLAVSAPVVLGAFSNGFSEGFA